MSQTLNDNLNIISGNENFEIEYLNGDISFISKLDDEPNDVGGMTSAELKAEFDKAGNTIKDYINNTLIPAILEDDATEAQRTAAEVQREANESARVSAEKSRVSAESNRASAEASRVAAEQQRVDETTGVVAKAKSWAVGNTGTRDDEGTNNSKFWSEQAKESANRAAQVVLKQIPDGSLTKAKMAPEVQQLLVGENLLRNWYFADPVDQRGGYVVPPGVNYYTARSQEETLLAGTTTAYTKVTRDSISPDWGIITVSGTSYYVWFAKAVRGYTTDIPFLYGFDRWKICAGTLLKGADSWRFVSKTTTSTYPRLVQLSEGTLKAGTTYTLSALVDIHSYTGNVVLRPCSSALANVSGASAHTITSADVGTKKLISVTFTPSADAPNFGVEILCLSNTGAASIDVDIYAAKLELGSEQTLAHQENGVWVLNEIPDYAEELAKCQRYFYRFNKYLLPSMSFSDSAWWFKLDFPVPMRATPAIGGLDTGKLITGGVSLDGATFELGSCNTEQVNVTCKYSTFTSTAKYAVSFINGNAYASAEL